MNLRKSRRLRDHAEDISRIRETGQEGNTSCTTRGFLYVDAVLMQPDQEWHCGVYANAQVYCEASTLYPLNTMFFDSDVHRPNPGECIAPLP
uniref:Uncharacterized protein n=1 Tax=viral metagenome TaxID=1070528 RepID=A0A6C0C0U8_9ZZZZ